MGRVGLHKEFKYHTGGALDEQKSFVPKLKQPWPTLEEKRACRKVGVLDKRPFAITRVADVAPLLPIRSALQRRDEIERARSSDTDNTKTSLASDTNRTSGRCVRAL